MPKLIFVLVVAGPLKGQKYFVKSSSKILIGRGEEANIRIEYDDFCSRRHALLYLEDGTGIIDDLNSTNGTSVNNERIFRKKELHSGDIINLGETELLVSIEDYPNGKTPP